MKLYTLFKIQDAEKHTVFSGTYVLRPNEGVLLLREQREDYSEQAIDRSPLRHYVSLLFETHQSVANAIRV